MKKNSLLLLAVLLLASCNRPMKLLEKSKEEKALNVSMKRLKRGKVKDSHLYVLEETFKTLTEEDAQWIESRKAAGNPALWVDIYNKAVAMDQRQDKAIAVVYRLNDAGYFPKMDFYPTKTLVDEAADNVALFYYAKAQEFIPAARNEDRSAAREAFRWLSEAQKYRQNFKDTDALIGEMRDIGTTHVLLNPIETNAYGNIDDRLFSAFLGNAAFPRRMNWDVLHRQAPRGEKIDFWLDLKFDEVYVSGDCVNRSSCSNTKQIKIGYETFEIWSESDTAYIEVTEPVFQDITVTVENYTQSKYAKLQVVCEMRATNDLTVKNSFVLSFTESWENHYSEVYGDRRALNANCKDGGGCHEWFPRDTQLLTNAARGVNRRFYRVLDRELDELPLK